MTDPPPIRRALISVYDKTGIVDFARALHEEFGVEIISTGGTARALTEAGIPVTLVETITGFPEMLDGRVKTLHPRIHAAILADRDNPEHMRQLAEAGIEPIDMVVVNLYPFEKTVADPNCTFEQAIEMIDIGGVALLRAAAKNHRHVLAVTDGSHFGDVLRHLKGRFAELQVHLANMAIVATVDYDIHVADWLARHVNWRPAYHKFLRLQIPSQLRYGENPHQMGCHWDLDGAKRQPFALAGTDLSFNNYVDASAALELCAELTRMAGKADSKLGTRHLWHRFPTGDLCSRFPTGSQPRGAAPRISEESHTRRNLPHIQKPEATYFVTFRVRTGQLAPAERDTVLQSCRHWHGRKMTLHCACVMPDHVHLLLTPHEVAPDQWVSLGEILHSVKRHSASVINRSRGTTGALWMDENFDRIMRGDAEFFEKYEYIEANPVTAGIAEPGAYPWFWTSRTSMGELVNDEEHKAGASHGLETRATRHRLETGATETTETGATETTETGATETGATETRATETGATETRATEAGATEAGATEAGATETVATGDEHGRTAVCLFIKHTNACGVGVAGACDASREAAAVARIEAYRRAYLGDPNAAMGGILAVNFPVDAEFAATVMETYARFGKPLRNAGPAGPAHPNLPGAFFIEVWIAPRFTDDAVAVIRGTYDPDQASPDEAVGETILGSPAPKKDWGKRVRLLAVGDMAAEPDPTEMDLRKIAGGVLMQTPDRLGLNEEQWKVVTKRPPDEREMADLRLAWLVCKHTKSNAITLCHDGMLIGNGAGQMSRVMSCRIATWLARENGHLGGGNREQGTGNREGGSGIGDRGSGGEAEATQSHQRSPVAASDAFFPFRDGVDVLIDAGVSAIIQPGGSKRDDEVIAACDERGVAMIFTGTRHFRH